MGVLRWLNVSGVAAFALVSVWWDICPGERLPATGACGALGMSLAGDRSGFRVPKPFGMALAAQGAGVVLLPLEEFP